MLRSVCQSTCSVCAHTQLFSRTHTAERKKDRTETDEHRIDEQPTTVSANPPNLEDTLIKLLAEKLEN